MIVTIARPRSSSIVRRRASTSSGNVTVIARDGRPLLPRATGSAFHQIHAKTTEIILRFAATSHSYYVITVVDRNFT